jgi:autoaggregation protein RapA/B/C
VAKPIARDDYGRIGVADANHAVSGNLLANDSSPGGSPIYLRFVDGIRIGDKGADTIQGTYGTFTFKPDGSYVYTLDTSNAAVLALQHGQTLTEQFDYKISNGAGGTDVGLLDVAIVGPNLRPVAVSDHFALDLSNGGTVTSNVLTNDSDADGDKLQASFIGSGSPLTYIPNNSNDVTFAGKYGSISIGRDGDFVYTVDPTKVAGLGNTDATEHFVYKIWDGQKIDSSSQADIYIDLTHHV